MRMVLTCLMIAGAATLGAGEPPLGNEDVVKLVRAGLSEDVILAKIDASETAFDTSTAGLVALADAKVPEAVIKRMLARASATAPAPSGQAPTAAGEVTPRGQPPAGPATAPGNATAANEVPAAGELLVKDLPRTRGLCSALGELRATKTALVYRPTKVTQVCEEYLSSAALEARWENITKVCFEYAVSGTVTIELKDGSDYSFKDKQVIVEGLENRLKELHPELPYRCE
jgi:hypothetical protein